MTSTGTLVITWLDQTDSVTQLRTKMRGAFPGACSRQATIIHTTLLRIVSATPLAADVVERVQVGEGRGGRGHQHAHHAAVVCITCFTGGGRG